jgi:hypothetical protein
LWRDLGPYLPPRNAYLLLHHAIYFNGHGTTEAQTVLLIYFGVAAVILGRRGYGLQQSGGGLPH